MTKIVNRFDITKNKQWVVFFLGIILLAACTPAEEEPSILVSLIADGRERTFSYNVPVTVGEFLRDVEVELGDLDRVNPPEFTQLSNGMRVTIVRVTEETECHQTEIPYRQERVLNEGLQPGQELLGQAGQNGTEEVCNRISIEDGERREPVEISRTVIVDPQPEIIYVGPTGQLEPVSVDGTLAYINNGNAWIITGSSTTKRPLTTDGGLDARVFSLSEDGRKLIFTHEIVDPEDPLRFNELWYISDVTRANEPTRLIPENILYGGWVPKEDNTISYSTGEGRQAAPGWQAFNDFWIMRLDPETGESINVQELVEASSGGLYGWWGTRYEWSPDGSQLAWVQADAVGIVDLDTGVFNKVLEYPVFRTFGDWSWRATVSWSPDANLFVTTVHGPPVGDEPPETSPAFDIAITDNEGSFQALIEENAGIWSAPTFSPITIKPDNEFPQGHLAYLRAREPFNSINGEYDLVVADRDGSNSRVVFPEENQPGLMPQEFDWSPDGRQIAFIYQGNLWIIDVESEVVHQLTLDGGASNPIWTQ